MNEIMRMYQVKIFEVYIVFCKRNIGHISFIVNDTGIFNQEI